MTAPDIGAAPAAPTAVPAPERITLRIGGRVFVAVGRTTTFAHQLWLAPHLKAAGLYDLLLGRETMDDADWAERILWRAHDSGRVLDLLAGSVAEEGHEWSEAAAVANRACFAAVTEPAECRALQAALVGLLFDFLVSGLGSVPISRSSTAPRNHGTAPAADHFEAVNARSGAPREPVPVGQ